MIAPLNTLDLTRAFAAKGGYHGNSPAMLNAIEQIRQHGIAEARKYHFERKKLVDGFKANPILLDGYLNQFSASPFLSLDEAARYYRDQVERQQTLRDAKHWRFDGAKLRVAGERLIVARFFRRFGLRIRLREAA